METIVRAAYWGAMNFLSQAVLFLFNIVATLAFTATNY